jgi:MarR family transcriptional regulator, organic hydroperoxide resistance regulator
MTDLSISHKKKLAADLTTLAILQHWEQVNPEDRVAHLVRDLARGFKRALQIRLSEFGVSFGHWVYLRALWENDGITQRELAVQVGLTEPTTHTAITKMLELGYVSRRHREGNKKKQYIFLTADGRALEEKLVPLAQEVNDIAVSGIDSKTVQLIRSGLLDMVRNLAVDEAQIIEDGKKLPSTRSFNVKS